MIAITIRLEPDRYASIEERRGDIPRADFLRDIIDTYLQQSDSPRIVEDTQKHLYEIEQLKKELLHSDTITSNLQTRISDLLSQIDSQKNQVKTLEQQLGFLQLEYQKMTDRLMLPAPKSWWQFWKK
jgi:predicted RNase H-like nuclease (RuvC/YqgF family)